LPQQLPGTTDEPVESIAASKRIRQPAVNLRKHFTRTVEHQSVRLFDELLPADAGARGG